MTQRYQRPLTDAQRELYARMAVAPTQFPAAELRDAIGWLLERERVLSQVADETYNLAAVAVERPQGMRTDPVMLADQPTCERWHLAIYGPIEQTALNESR